MACAQTKFRREVMAGATGLEPATFGVTGQEIRLLDQRLFQILECKNGRQMGTELERIEDCLGPSC